MPLSIGVIGVGAIGSAFVSGICTSPSLLAQGGARVTLSPRGAEHAAALAVQFGGAVAVAGTNQEVVDAAEWVVVAVLPPQATEVLSQLIFQARNKILSFVPAGLVDLRPLVGQARKVVCAIPLPPCAHQLGPIAMFPPDAEAEALLAHVGSPVPVSTLAEINVLQSGTALIAPAYELLSTCAGWMRAQGLPDAAATRFLGSMFHCISVEGLKADGAGTTFGDLAGSAQTPGGLNEQCVGELLAGGAFPPWPAALENVRRRLEVLYV